MNCTKVRAARAARLFSSFNQSDHCFLALSLALQSSLLKLPNNWKLASNLVPVFSVSSIGQSTLLYFYLVYFSRDIFQTNQRYEADEMKRAQDASKDARFSAILAIIFGCSIVFFCIFIFTIVPVLGD